ncbi:hypothetical protein SSX86_017153 [Deinandra increscens subsp. villosa]|uniref:B box-type domain-containing protein n=1 Tax=Deinandra increscens subsp. villosa TaxID=3103831 RepID=A0AAP0GU04_9ASTR
MGDVIAGTGGSGIKRLYPPSQKTCGGVPQWVKVMIDIMQYQDCKIHSNAKDNKLDRFCIDCVGSFCNQCSSDHQGHEHIKVFAITELTEGAKVNANGLHNANKEPTLTPSRNNRRKGFPCRAPMF